jgi:hypothetical protein
LCVSGAASDCCNFPRSMVNGRQGLEDSVTILTMVFFMVSTLMTTGKPAPVLDFSGLLLMVNRHSTSSTYSRRKPYARCFTG